MASVRGIPKWLQPSPTKLWQAPLSASANSWLRQNSGRERAQAGEHRTTAEMQWRCDDNACAISLVVRVTIVFNIHKNLQAQASSATNRAT